jgi:hypothetical protein
MVGYRRPSRLAPTAWHALATWTTHFMLCFNQDTIYFGIHSRLAQGHRLLLLLWDPASLGTSTVEALMFFSSSSDLTDGSLTHSVAPHHHGYHHTAGGQLATVSYH